MILKNLFLKIVLCVSLLCAIFCTPVFAASEDSPQPSEVPSHISSYLAPDLDDVEAKALTEEIYDKLSEGTRADATLTDVYNILRYDILPGLKGSVSNSNYSLPRIAYYSEQSWGKITDIRNLLYMPNVGSNPTMRSPFWYQVSSSNYSLADLQGMTWARVGDILSTLNLSNSYLSAISSQLSGYNWQQFPGSYSGIKTNPQSSSYISSYTISHEFYVYYNLNNNFSRFPNILRIFVPVYFQSYSSAGRASFDSVSFSFANGSVASLSDFDYFTESTLGGTYFYFIDFYQRQANSFCVHLTNSSNIVHDPTYPGSMYYIPFDTDEYQQMKQAFYQAKAANAQGSMASDVNRLADYLADPDKIAAEQASQQVIDDTLDGFTGNGSAAAKTSDTGSMKNMSGSIQSGLNSGASASNAASVFSNQTFWSWFTQATSNGINNPYPAPVVQNTRGSGDDVPDFLSGNQAELNDLLNQRDSW